MEFKGESKTDGTIVEGTLTVEGLETWITTPNGRTAVWPDPAKVVIDEVKNE